MYMQTIFFAAPGTGKSHEITEILKENNIPENKVFRITIHPEYSYSDFVGQLLPTENEETKQLIFEFKSGQFTEALVEAYKDTSKNVFLIIEELSRGNVSAIFGDIFQLLDRDEYFNSKYPIRNSEIAQKLKQPTNIIKLPSNFNILGTVNVNDQNVFPMDTAFKRRFDWRYVSSKPIVDTNGLTQKKLNNPRIIINKNDGNIETNWQSFYSSLNNYITDKENGLAKNEDKQVGQFFVVFNEEDITNSYSSEMNISESANERVNELLKNKLLLYLWQDVQGVAAFGNNKSIFSQSITSFDKLYDEFGTTQVFHDDFLNNFLEKEKNKYTYE